VNRPLLISLVSLALLASPALARKHSGAHSNANTGRKGALTLDAINTAELPGNSRKSLPAALYVRAQILLDRAHFSPGEIDARETPNFRRALAGFAADRKLQSDGTLSAELWTALKEASPDPAIIRYTISKRDTQGPFAERIPKKLEEQADLPRLGYRHPLEELGEKFHVAPALLKRLNPKVKLDDPGSEIVVPNVTPIDSENTARKSDKPKAERIEVDKQALTVRAFDEAGKLLAFYPASVGSEDKPAPDGELEVTRVAYDPTYTYNPKYGFKGVEADKKFTIKPGPNNPVGLVWIELKGEGYGVHGTPEPANITQTASHGCVRLTNWDALNLASMAHKGTRAAFLNGTPLVSSQEPKAKTQ
jgi:lipoprotein-anchoring transpeptidase ErfK/SrfK